MQTNHVKITKELRVELDATLQKLKTANQGPGSFNPPAFDENSMRSSHERSLAVTRIQEAIMWLGMDLKALKEAGLSEEPNPYPSSYNPQSAVVEPTAQGLKL